MISVDGKHILGIVKIKNSTPREYPYLDLKSGYECSIKLPSLDSNGWSWMIYLDDFLILF